MPSYRCKHPTCAAILARPGHCAAHQPIAAAVNAERHRLYDETQRDQETKRFYGSHAWQLARNEKLTNTPVCERCQTDWAREVHHRQPAREFPELRTTQSNLEALCPACHRRHEARKTAQKRKAP